mmetsp:Transcript_15457/g.38046  ORF Transcript_15457/g.38046 Transcript_15457/m.38046 type:complete len:842 (+) Transcript_15457:180-2705(+)
MINDPDGAEAATGEITKGVDSLVLPGSENHQEYNNTARNEVLLVPTAAPVVIDGVDVTNGAGGNEGAAGDDSKDANSNELGSDDLAPKKLPTQQQPANGIPSFAETPTEGTEEDEGDEDEDETPRVPSVVMRLIVQSADSGKVIGPKGSTVQRFKQKTGANISLSTFQAKMPRVATVSGPVKGVAEAIMLICRAVASEPNTEFEELLEDEKDKVLAAVLIVPFPHVGRIIGKRGQRIKMLREESGTTITIVANNITISGRYHQLECAINRLTELLQEVSRRNPASAFAFTKREPAQSYPPYGFDGHISQGGGPQGPMSAHPDPNARTVKRNMVSSTSLQYHMAQSSPGTMQVLVPSSSAGVVIGRRGSTIQKMKADSGAGISLSNYVKRAENRVATISGAPHAMAKAIIAVAGQLATDGGKNPENANSLSMTMLVPRGELGAIIGKKGARITELRNSTNANINVADEGSVEVAGDMAAFSEAVTKITFLLYETRTKISSSHSHHLQAGPETTNTPAHPASVNPAEGKSPVPSPEEASNTPKGKDKASAQDSTPSNKSQNPASPVMFSSTPVDSKIFLPGLLQNMPKFSPTGGRDANDGPGKASINQGSRKKPDHQHPYPQAFHHKPAMMKAHIPSDKAGLPILPSLAGHAFPVGTNQMAPMFHFSDVLHQPIPQSQQAQQLLLIGNHWQHAQALSRGQPVPQQSPPSQGGTTDGPLDRKIGGSKSPMQAQLLGGLGSINLAQSPGAHQIPQSFPSPFPSMQGSPLGQNFYAGASWYTPTQRFQPYSDVGSPQPWQPAHRQHQQQSPPSVVVPSAVPINQSVSQPQTVSAEGLRTNRDPWKN